jgi:hypothetical protein
VGCEIESGDELTPEAAEFFKRSGALPEVVTAEADPAAVQGSASPAAAVGLVVVGWPPEFYGLLFAVLFAAVGEKYRLNPDEQRLLGQCAKQWWDTIQGADTQSPLVALLMALTTVIASKVGAEHLVRLVSGKLQMPGSTPTASSTGDSSSSENLEAENLSSSFDSFSEVPVF